MGATLWIMGRYFTVLANALVLLVFAGLAARQAPPGTPVVLGGITLVILLVGIVYGLLLTGLFTLDSARAWWADLLLHRVVPALVPLFWLACAPKGGLRNRDPLLWGVVPLGYFLYALLRGAAEGLYAYPFLDLAQLGWPRVLLNGGAMGLGFLVAGFGLVWLDRALA